MDIYRLAADLLSVSALRPAYGYLSRKQRLEAAESFVEACPGLTAMSDAQRTAEADAFYSRHLVALGYTGPTDVGLQIPASDIAVTRTPS